MKPKVGLYFINLYRLIPKINCAAIGGDDLFAKVYSWVSFCTNALVPFFTLCILNLFIIRAIRNR